MVLGALVVVLGVGLLYVTLRLKKDDGQSALLIKEDLRGLSEDITKLKDHMQAQVADRMEKSQSLMLGSLQRQSVETNKNIAEITRNLTELKDSNKRVVDVAEELKTLQNVLQNR